MKKRVCVFFCLALAFALAAGLTAGKIGGSREAVRLAVTPVYGDVSAISGAEVDFNVIYGQHLLWENRWSPEMGDAAASEFHFSLFERHPEQSESVGGLRVYSSPAENFGGYAGKRENDLDRAYREAYESVKPGERKQFVFRIADYLDYYPLAGRLELPGASMNFFSTFDETAVEFITRLEGFLRIPVLPDEIIEVDVDRSSDGATTGIGSGSKEENDSYRLETSGFVTEEACFFTFSTRTAQGKIVDTSQIPGGYGIYRLPYAVAEGKVQVDAADCELFFAMDPADDVYEMFCVGGRIYLVLTEGEDTVLRVLELATGRELSRLVMTSGVRLYELRRFDGFMVLADSEEYLTVVTLGETPAVELQVKNVHTELKGFNFGSRETMAWDGARLLIAQTLSVQENWVEGSGFRLVVYDAAGLRYAGIYQSSLLCAGDGNNWSDMCRPDNYGPELSVRWE